MSVELLHGDCMAYMAALPDNAFDLAIVDPPYGIDKRLLSGGGYTRYSAQRLAYSEKQWDVAPPPPEYFEQLQRVSAHRIIWGGNYFGLPPTRGVVAWVKPPMRNHPHFSQWEMAWTSFDSSAKVVEMNPSHFEGTNIHPTQKPVALYRWLLHNYAKPGWRILDTHLGSGSSAIAAHEMGFDFVGIEIDADYIAAARKRFDMMTAQQRLDI